MRTSLAAPLLPKAGPAGVGISCVLLSKLPETWAWSEPAVATVKWPTTGVVIDLRCWQRRFGLLLCAGVSGEAQDAKRARLAEGTQANGRPRPGQPQSPRGGAASAAAAAAANGHGADLSKGRPKRQVCVGSRQLLLALIGILRTELYGTCVMRSVTLTGGALFL